ncbi:MAG TPA: AlkA N-terminal domain-containing protein [Kofleriaceae bacterium]|nr:AlkA N-terminal domain-containing protein [Kofleriaceae bacterium]
MTASTFVLHPIPPFSLDLTAWALRRRPNNTIDRWDGRTYSRTIAVGHHAVDVDGTQAGRALHVTISGGPITAATRAAARATLVRALGLDLDLTAFYRMAKHDRRLAPLVARFRGVKPPRFPSVFEALVNGIACQQLSLTVGIILLGRLAERCGLRSKRGNLAFPRPRDVATLAPGQVHALGFTRAKSHALVELARAAETGLDLEALAALPDADVLAQLVALRGVGRWTAEYVLLRGLGRLTMFPGDDVGARTNLARWMKLREPLDYDSVRRLARRWQPYAGFLYFHLLLQSLDEAGRLTPGAPAR